MCAEQVGDLIGIKRGLRERLPELVEHGQVVAAAHQVRARIRKALHHHRRAEQAERHDQKGPAVERRVDYCNYDRQRQRHQFHQERIDENRPQKFEERIRAAA